MSNLSNQIKLLFEQGNTPVTIADLLDLNLTDVLLVLNSIGLIKNTGVIESKSLNEVTPDHARPISGVSTDVNDITPEKIFSLHKVQIAERICQLALTSDNDSAAAKCAIYANEETTGRNEARAVRNRNVGKIINIDKLLIHMNQTNDRLAETLGSKCQLAQEIAV